MNLVAEERTAKGSYTGSAAPSRDIQRFIALYRNGLLPWTDCSPIRWR